MEKTVTFTVTDALLSPIGFSILSGAGLFKDANKNVHVHRTATAAVSAISSSSSVAQGVIDLTSALGTGEFIDVTAPIFVSVIENDGSLTGTIISNVKAGDASATEYPTTSSATSSTAVKLFTPNDDEVGKNVFVDFYVVKPSNKVSEIQIDATSFGGNFYVEASSLFKDQSTGKDLPVEITFPNVKIQSNFTFNMSATGDPSTFDFVMDVMPGYTTFDRSHKVMGVVQIVEDTQAGATSSASVMGHTTGFTMPEAADDSGAGAGEA